MFTSPIAHLIEFKTRIAQYIQNVITETLQSVVEHAANWFQLVVENVGQHAEHVLCK